VTGEPAVPVAASTPGGQTLPLTPEILAYGLSTLGDPQVSPDGTRLVYALQTVNPDTKRSRSQIWLCEVDGAGARPLTALNGHAGGARWSPDGSQIACTMARGDGQALSVLSIDGDEEGRELTRHAQGIGDLAWSPDGGRIAYTTLFDPENPDELPRRADAAPPVRVTRRLDYKQDGRGFVGDKRRHVFVLDIVVGARRRLTIDLSDHSAPQWSPDGRWLAVHAPNPQGGGSHLFLAGVDSGERRPVSPDGCPVEQWAWSPSGDKIVYAGDPEHRFQPDYFVFDLASGRSRRLTEECASIPAAGFGPPVSPIWLSERQLLLHTVRAAASQLELLDIETGEIKLLRRWQARHSGLSADRAARVVAQVQSSLTASGQVIIYDRERDTVDTIIAPDAPLLEQHPAARWEQLAVRRGELTIDAWLLLPPDFDPAKRYPLILDVHGGPSGNYGYGFMAHQQCLATNGFLVLYANPRGSTSYGGHFARQVMGDWGGGDYQDLMAVVDTVLERSYADRERTGIFGFSYGGYMTAWVISQTDRFKAAVCGEPFFDLESSYGTSMNGRGIAAHAGGPPHERREWYALHSPSTFAHRTRTPTLLIQGEADDICPVGQTEQMFTSLKQAGCEVEFVRYPGGSHMFFAMGLPEHRADFLARTLAWFKSHLGEPV